MENKVKNLLLTQTFWSGILLLLLSVQTPVTQLVQGKKLTIDIFYSFVLSIAGLVGVTNGRYKAGDVYTPKLLPGKGKQQLLDILQENIEKNIKL